MIWREPCKDCGEVFTSDNPFVHRCPDCVVVMFMDMTLRGRPGDVVEMYIPAEHVGSGSKS